MKVRISAIYFYFALMDALILLSVLRIYISSTLKNYTNYLFKSTQIPDNKNIYKTSLSLRKRLYWSCDIS